MHRVFQSTQYIKEVIEEATEEAIEELVVPSGISIAFQRIDLSRTQRRRRHSSTKRGQRKWPLTTYVYGGQSEWSLPASRRRCSHLD